MGENASSKGDIEIKITAGTRIEEAEGKKAELSAVKDLLRGGRNPTG